MIPFPTERGIGRESAVINCTTAAMPYDRVLAAGRYILSPLINLYSFEETPYCAFT